MIDAEKYSADSRLVVWNSIRDKTLVEQVELALLTSVEISGTFGLNPK